MCCIRTVALRSPSIVMPESGVNVYEVMDGLKATVADLAANELERAGLDDRAGLR